MKKQTTAVSQVDILCIPSERVEGRRNRKLIGFLLPVSLGRRSTRRRCGDRSTTKSRSGVARPTEAGEHPANALPSSSNVRLSLFPLSLYLPLCQRYKTTKPARSRVSHPPQAPASTWVQLADGSRESSACCFLAEPIFYAPAAANKVNFSQGIYPIKLRPPLLTTRQRPAPLARVKISPLPLVADVVLV